MSFDVTALPANKPRLLFDLHILRLTSTVADNKTKSSGAWPARSVLLLFCFGVRNKIETAGE